MRKKKAILEFKKLDFRRVYFVNLPIFDQKFLKLYLFCLEKRLLLLDPAGAPTVTPIFRSAITWILYIKYTLSQILIRAKPLVQANIARKSILEISTNLSQLLSNWRSTFLQKLRGIHPFYTYWPLYWVTENKSNLCQVNLPIPPNFA